MRCSMSTRPFRKRVFAAAPYKTVFLGPGRKEFDPKKKMPSFETYLKETAEGTLRQVAQRAAIDEGIIGSFMASRFLKQANIPAFLPFMVPELELKPCTGVEGACGTGGRAIAMAIRSVLSEQADSVFVAGFEVQNTVKSVYGADILAGAAYYAGERKEGHAFFFPGIFSERARHYQEKFGKEMMRQALARWYERAVINARTDPKAQEFHNGTKDLYALGLTEPDPKVFLSHLNHYDCSKVSDGAASLIVASEEGLKKLGIKEAVEIIGLGEAEADITAPPKSMTRLTTSENAAQKALQMAHKQITDMGLVEVHDCFTISGLLSLEALGLAPEGQGARLILDQKLPPINLSGGLIGFGHPTGASGVRMLVDLTEQLTGKASHPAHPKNPLGLMLSMGGNDKTVTSIIVTNI